MGILVNKMDMCWVKISAAALILLGLAGCGERDGLAPVTELNWRAANTRPTQYVVMRKDTLYAIAFRYDKDYRDLARENHIQSPYSLRVGQVIRIQPTFRTYVPQRNTQMYRSPRTQAHRYAVKQAPAPQATYARPVPFWRSSRWTWPANGRVVANFVPTQGKKGLDIAGAKGDKIYAAGNGTVAYAGSGLAGYGNLIIIKHDSQFLTAYGNNARNIVSEGQTVHAGQVIADMGVVDRRFWGVHFEIRQAGNPVNPLNYLQARR